jgi:hypothetical protein
MDDPGTGPAAVTADTARAGGDGCETGHRTDWEGASGFMRGFFIDPTEKNLNRSTRRSRRVKGGRFAEFRKI